VELKLILKSNKLQVFILFVFASFSSIAYSQVVGQVMVVKGDSKLIRDSELVALKVGVKIFGGDVIKTGSDGRVKVVMNDKNVLTISTDSEITIAKYDNNNVLLDLSKGKIRAEVNQRYDGENRTFNVKTPTTVAGVRGTDFLTAFDKLSGISKVTTFAGAVAVGNLGSNGKILNAVYVKPGEQTTVSPGAPPSAPIKASTEDLKSDQEQTVLEPSAEPEKKQEVKEPAPKEEPKADENKDSKKDEPTMKTDQAAKQEEVQPKAETKVEEVRPESKVTEKPKDVKTEKVEQKRIDSDASVKPKVEAMVQSSDLNLNNAPVTPNFMTNKESKVQNFNPLNRTALPPAIAKPPINPSQFVKSKTNILIEKR
jgi:flagellar biosynthesis GTPase FlhF